MENKKTIYTVLILFLISSLTGFKIVSESYNSSQKYEKKFNFTMNSSEGVKEFKFDNRSVKFFHSGFNKSKFYIDVNNDGEIDREIKIRHDGEIHSAKTLVGKRSKTYRIYFRYQDDPSKDSDVWMEIYLVERLE